MSRCQYEVSKKVWKHYSFGDTFDIDYYCAKRNISIGSNTCENCMKEIALEILNKK